MYYRLSSATPPISNHATCIAHAIACRQAFSISNQIRCTFTPTLKLYTHARPLGWAADCLQMHFDVLLLRCTVSIRLYCTHILYWQRIEVQCHILRAFALSVRRKEAASSVVKALTFTRRTWVNEGARKGIGTTLLPYIMHRSQYTCRHVRVFVTSECTLLYGCRKNTFRIIVTSLGLYHNLRVR